LKSQKLEVNYFLPAVLLTIGRFVDLFLSGQLASDINGNENNPHKNIHTK